MKSLQNISRFIAFLILSVTVQTLSAQSTKADIFNDATEITWLGMDFTQTKIIGSAAQFGDAGEITNAQLKERFIPGWNKLFIDEMKKYNVADVVHRSEVKYAMEVTEKANDDIKKDFYSNSPDDYALLNEQKIGALVKKYDFAGKTGVGMMLFIEGMSKGKVEASGWVTFVDMKTKTVLLTVRETGKPGGIGFKNYWAKAFLLMLKAAKSDYSDWKKK